MKRNKREKQRIILGMILSILSLILLHRNFIILGLAAFIVGFLLINGGKMPWKSRK